MQEIADAAGVSKSLLFHYFRNKRELYLYLWKHCEELTLQALKKYGCFEEAGLFERMERGMRAKLWLIRRYPDLGAFAVKAFYEKDPAVAPAIQASCRHYRTLKEKAAMMRIDPGEFRPGLDLTMMYREMFLAAEGYLWELTQGGDRLDLNRLEEDFTGMLAFWKEIYLRKEE